MKRNKLFTTTCMVALLCALPLPAPETATGTHDIRKQIVQFSAKLNALSIKAHNVPLKVILHELEQQCGIEISVLGPANDLVNAEISSYPLEDSIKLLLQGYAHTISHEPGRKGKIASVFLYPGKTGGPTRTTPQNKETEERKQQPVPERHQLHHGLACPGERLQ